MPKYQQEFFEYLIQLEAQDERFVDTALTELFKYWKMYEKEGVKDSLRTAMDSTRSFVGMPIVVHANSSSDK